jgi:hypothetical protein
VLRDDRDRVVNRYIPVRLAQVRKTKKSSKIEAPGVSNLLACFGQQFKGMFFKETTSSCIAGCKNWGLPTL